MRSPAAFSMWLLGWAGMVFGLAVDSRSVTAGALANLCNAAPNSLLFGIGRHLELLPATNFGMLLGSLAASLFLEMSARPSTAAGYRWPVFRRIGFNLACNLAMLACMALAGCLGPAWAEALGLQWGTATMVAAMTVGMTGGMIATAISFRLAAELWADVAMPAPRSVQNSLTA